MFADLVTDAQALDDAALVARFNELEATARRLEGELAAVLGDLDRRKVHRADGHASLRGWLRGRALWSDQVCTQRLRVMKLAAAVPAVGDGLLDGSVGVPQAAEMGRAHANPRCAGQFAAVADVLVREAGRLGFDEFRIVVQRWETLADADGAHRDHEATHAARRATLVAHGGVLHLSGLGGAVDAAAMIEIHERFCRAEFLTDWEQVVARWGPDASPTLLARTDAQRRFDALRAIFEAAASAPPGSVPPEPVVNVTVDQVTFETHLARRHVVRLRPDLPDLDLTQRRCETTSGIPLTPEEALQAAMAGHVRRVVFDSAGTAIDLGRKRRLFTGPAADAVRLASPMCAHKGCSVSARRCELDHLVDWQHDGDTDQDNAAPRCRTHHRAKERGFRVWRDDGGQWHTYRPDGSEVT